MTEVEMESVLTVHVQQSGRLEKQHNFLGPKACSVIAARLREQYGPGSMIYHSYIAGKNVELLADDLLKPGQVYTYSIDPRAEPKLVHVLEPPFTYGNFDSWVISDYPIYNDSDYEKLMGMSGVAGLRLVAEDLPAFLELPEDQLFAKFEQGEVVREFDVLCNGGVYVFGGVTKSALADVRGELSHLNQRREGVAEQGHEREVGNREPHEDFAAHPELRTSLPHPSGRSCGEVDSGIFGNTKVYGGSHKTYIDKTKPVVEVADDCQWLTQQSKDNPAALPEAVRGRESCAAVMGEQVKPSIRKPMAKVCKQPGVLQLRRNGRGISPAQCHHMQRLLRF